MNDIIIICYDASVHQGKLLNCINFPQVWNQELASVAQRYSETCMFGPNPNRANQAPIFDTVGENRAFGRTTNYTDLIERGWFVQRSNFNFSRNICLSPGACDEYTQVCLKQYP